MDIFIKTWPPAAGAIALSCFCAFLPAGRARAQAPPPAPGPVAGRMTVGALLTRLGREANVAVVADSSVDTRAPIPGGVVFPPATAQSVEQRLDALVRALLPGVTWTKLYLPPPAARAYNGDDLSAFVAAEARLFGTNGGLIAAAAAQGTDGKTIIFPRLSTDDVKKTLSALDVHPVYLVANGAPGARAGGTGGSGADALAAWSQLTPAQRDQATAGILNMNPALRNQMMQQMVSVFTTVMQKMTPEERRQMFAGTPITPGATGRPDLP